MWHAISASVRGAAHLRGGQPNQDAVLVELTDGALPAILAASDGHGSDKCIRSHIGSQLAVEIAVSVLRDFAWTHAERLVDELETEVARLPNEIVRRWRAAVSN